MSPFEPDRAPREPRRVGESLGKATAHLGAAADQVALVFGRWREIAGDVVAAHATPVALRRNTLVVEVEDNAWAMHVRYLAEDLRRQVETVLGEGSVASVEVRIKPPPGGRRKGGANRPRSPRNP